MSVEGFAAVPNWMVRDKKISGHALAVYTALASHTGPGGIHPSQPTIAWEARISESSVRRALIELESLGVVERVRRKGTVGRATNGYVLNPHGHLRADEERVEVAVTVTDTPEVTVSGTGGSGQGVQVTPYIKEEPIKKSLSIVSPSSDELFEAAWKHWPRGDKKKNARDKFLRLKNQVEVAAAIVEHGDAHAKYSGKFVPHLITWLNGSRWEEAAPGPRAADGGSRSTLDIGRETHEILRERAAARERQAVNA